MTTKVKVLVGLIGLLMVLNVLLMVIVWRGREKGIHPMPGAGSDARNYLVTTLALNERQVQLFDNLRKDHFERMKAFQDSIRHYKDALFTQIAQPSTAPADSAAYAIGQWQAKADLETFLHFRQFRSLLTTAQTRQFDVVIQEVLHTMAPPGGPPGPPRR